MVYIGIPAYILTFYVTFFLAYTVTFYLTFFLAFYLASILTFYSYGHLSVLTGHKWDYTFYKWD